MAQGSKLANNRAAAKELVPLFLLARARLPTVCTRGRMHTGCQEELRAERRHLRARARPGRAQAGRPVRPAAANLGPVFRPRDAMALVGTTPFTAQHHLWLHLKHPPIAGAAACIGVCPGPGPDMRPRDPPVRPFVCAGPVIGARAANAMGAGPTCVCAVTRREAGRQ